MIEQGAAVSAEKIAAAVPAGAVKAGMGKMMPFMPALALVGLAGIIAYEFWKGGKDTEAMQKVKA